jgi:hypothetical protein
MNQLKHRPIRAREDSAVLYSATFPGRAADAPRHFSANREAVANGRIAKRPLYSRRCATPQFPPVDGTGSEASEEGESFAGEKRVMTGDFFGRRLGCHVPGNPAWTCPFRRKRWNMIPLEYLRYFQIDTIGIQMRRNAFKPALTREPPHDIAVSHFIWCLSQICLPLEAGVPRYLGGIGIPASAGLPFAPCMEVGT